MTEVRPDEETVPLLGAEVRIADAAGLLAAAVDGPVELLVDGDTIGMASCYVLDGEATQSLN
ncbi:hypothetical protein ACWEOR_31210, partial [Micromonospora chalcea]